MKISDMRRFWIRPRLKGYKLSALNFSRIDKAKFILIIRLSWQCPCSLNFGTMLFFPNFRAFQSNGPFLWKSGKLWIIRNYLKSAWYLNSTESYSEYRTYTQCSKTGSGSRVGIGIEKNLWVGTGRDRDWKTNYESGPGGIRIENSSRFRTLPFRRWPCLI